MGHKTKDARREWFLKWKEANPEAYKEKNRSWYARNGRGLHLKNTYGLSQEDYELLLAKQGGVCGICGAPPPPDRALCVDHDHNTGLVRGLLCILCNTHLEWLAENQTAANAYLG